jgi:integrase/recombinase XerD
MIFAISSPALPMHTKEYVHLAERHQGRRRHRAFANCGHCVVTHAIENGQIKTNRCAEGPYCTRWFLHKFRHTYATRHLQDGIDIRTLQQWMGHRDMASTMVYLKGLRNKDVQARINKGTLAAFI